MPHCWCQFIDLSPSVSGRNYAPLLVKKGISRFKEKKGHHSPNHSALVCGWVWPRPASLRARTPDMFRPFTLTKPRW